MARGITWRQVTAGNPSNAASFGRNAIGAFSAAQQTFSELGDFFGERADQRATATALQEAMQTGELPTEVDPRADLGLVSDLLSERSGREVDAQTLLLGEEELTAQRFANRTAQERFDAEMGQIEAATGASNASAAASRTQELVAQLELEGAQQEAKDDEAARLATQTADAWYDGRLEDRVFQLRQEAANSPGNWSDLDIKTVAAQQLQREMNTMYLNGTLHREMGMSRANFERSRWGQRFKTAMENESKVLAKNNPGAEKEAGAEQYQANIQAAMGGDTSAFVMGPDGYLKITTGKPGNTYEPDQIKNMVESRFVGLTGKNPVTIPPSALSQLSRSLEHYDKSVADQLMSMAEKRSDGDPELYVNNLLFVTQQMTRMLTHESTREESLKQATMPDDISRAELLRAYTSGESAERPDKTNYLELIDKELEKNMQSWWQNTILAEFGAKGNALVID